MAIFNNKNKFDKSNISLNKLGTIKYYEKIKQKKLNYIDYGITYTDKEIFKVLLFCILKLNIITPANIVIKHK